MISGIYKLVFNNDSYYIGKSNDIERRWKEHNNKFNKGTAAKALQNAFDNHGYPEFHILCECHSDHIDLLESIYISISFGNTLNSAAPIFVSAEDKGFLLQRQELLTHSTADHLRTLYNQAQKLDVADKKYKKLLNKDKYVKDLVEDLELLELDIEVLVQKNKKLNQEVHRLKNMGFWERVFS